ncbi:MAG: PD40 domain-containing protein [Acidobacteria bacterium]|nr:PD40 domain-containing protein [Acidobacteriota bacterium]MBI3422510.1 PD40 domain-containing protein [Acidobacteriota bacterium]
MSKPHNHFYEFGPFRLDVANRLLLRDGEVVPLKKKAYDMLLVLVENNGQVLEKEELMRRLWPDTYVEESNLTHYIYTLRRVLGDEKDNPQFIVTIPGRGYRFTAQVSEQHPTLLSGLVEDEPLVLERHTLSRVVINETSTASKSTSVALATKPVATLPAAASPQPGSWQRRAGFVAAGLIALAAGLYFWLNRPNAAATNATTAKFAPLTGLAGREDTPTFSPDGRQIAYAWRPEEAEGMDIYVKLVGAGQPLRLTNNPHDEYSPAWSPDGKTIAFLRARGQGSEVLILPALGGTERKIADLQTTWVGLTWTPDGKALVVPDAIATSDKESAALVQINLETGERHTLTNPPALSGDDDPRFAPDGKQLAFKRTLNRVNSEVFLANPDGSQPRPLTKLAAPIHGLAWLADGQALICAAYREGSNSLWRVPVNGNPPVLLEAAGRKATHPAFAANGATGGGTLGFVDSLEDANLWRLDLDQPNPALRKFISSSHPDHSPEFSPDGQRLVFSSGRSGHDEIWVCQSDGSNPVQLTHFNGLATGSPHWSPDGQQIAFDARPESSGDLFIINSTGGAPRRVTTDSSHDVIPSWSHDGRWLYFCSNRSGKLQLWKMPVAGGPAQQLTQQGGMEAFEAPDGKSVYYLKGRGISGLWRVSTEGTNEEAVPELAEAGYWRYWTINRSGLYFVAHNDQFPYQVRHFDFTTRRVRTIATIDKQPAWLTAGLAVAPTGRQILFASNDLFASSIMLLENFH